MSNITFSKIENNVKMYGSNQVGVYVDNELKYYIAESEYATPIRIFTFPENNQLGTFINKYKPLDFSEMRFLVINRFAELVASQKEHVYYFIKVTYVNGLFGSVSRDHLDYGYISLGEFGFTTEKFSPPHINKLKKFIETKSLEFKDVSKIEIINTIDFSIETINIQ
ncbi:hypothetical protein [Aeromonas phage AerS_266]|nr:hypothetical protein [Aeromonas phage AerS_266]